VTSQFHHICQGLLVHLEIAHSVHNDSGTAQAAGFLQSVLADLEWAAPAILAVHGDVELLAKGLQLLGSGHTLGVGGYQQGAIAAPAQVERQLGGGGGLARSL